MDSAPYPQLQTRLMPLTDANRPYSLFAREALAMAKLLAGKTDEAKKDFTVIGFSLGAPQDMRERAQVAIAVIDAGDAPAAVAGRETCRHNAAATARNCRTRRLGRAPDDQGTGAQGPGRHRPITAARRSRPMTTRRPISARHRALVAVALASVALAACAHGGGNPFRAGVRTRLPRHARGPAHLVAGTQRPADGVALAEGPGLLPAGSAADGRLADGWWHAGELGRERRRGARLPDRLEASLRCGLDGSRPRHGAADRGRRQGVRDGRRRRGVGP